MEIDPDGHRPEVEEEAHVCVVLVTVPDAEAGRSLVREVVGARLAACGNLIPGITSLYWWKGELQQDQESLVIFKTTAGRTADLTRKVGDLHPYDVPEILVLSVSDGHLPYLEWVRGEVKEPERP